MTLPNQTAPKSLNFQVDGNILNELSTQVTSHLFALGELIKNSYDAEATSISIKLDLSKNTLIIEDNGTGISYENAKSLFHIAKSTKTYGKEFTFLTPDGLKVTRLTQGSKGLGLLSSFKFGNIVSWDSKCGKEKILITVDKNEIVNLSNINDISYPILQGSRSTNGTTINIKLHSNDDKEIAYIYNYFKELKNSKKLTNFFHDSSIKIELTLKNKNGEIEKDFPVTTKPISQLLNNLKPDSFLKIDYNSDNNIITFTNKEDKVYTSSFESKNTIRNYKIRLSILAYLLRSGGKNKIDKLFHNKNNDLSPLVYINGTLFNNDQIFDPSITRSIQSSKTLPQLIGFVEIFSTDEGLQFNNERTDLITNLFNTELKDDIANLNKFLQARGKMLNRNPELFMDTPKNDQNADLNTEKNDQNADLNTEKNDQNTDLNTEKNDQNADLNTEKNDQNADLNTEKNDQNANDSSPPTIFLKKNVRDIYIDNYPTLIDLKEYFISACDSNRVNIPIQDITITINGRVSQYPFLEQIDSPLTAQISYAFTDNYLKSSNGKNIKYYEYLKINFCKKDFSFHTDKAKPPLISCIGNDYTFHLNGVGELIEQLNKLWENHQEYDMCIAAAVRIIFDLTNYRFETLAQYNFKDKGTESKVAELVEMIASEKSQITALSKILGSRFSIVKNIFQDPGLFSTKVSISNLGSHTGSQHMSIDTIKDLAKYAGYYAQLVDAYCRHKDLIDQ